MSKEIMSRWTTGFSLRAFATPASVTRLLIGSFFLLSVIGMIHDPVLHGMFPDVAALESRSTATDAKGIAEFLDVPEGWGYRYGIAADTQVEVGPPHENDGADVVFDGKGAIAVDRRCAVDSRISRRSCSRSR